MGYPSYADSINDISCTLEHVAGFSSKPAELDTGAARTVIAAAELLLCQMRAAHEVATDTNLEVPLEVVRLRLLVTKQEEKLRNDQERINGLSREAAERARETEFWRDEYFKLSRRAWPTRRRRPSGRHC